MPGPILCLDFDGVLHSYTSGWKGFGNIPDPPTPGAMEFLKEAVRHFEVHIFSSRSSQPGGVHAMKQWLLQHSGPDHALVDSLHWPTTKPAAFVTLDDRAITFTGEWPAMETLRTFVPWNKK